MSNEVLLHVCVKLLLIGELNSFIFVNTGIPQRYCGFGSRAPQSSITIKRIIILLLVEGPAFDL